MSANVFGLGAVTSF